MNHASQARADTSMMMVVHRAFLRDLGLMSEEVGRPVAHSGRRRRLLASRWRHFRRCLELHHVAEDTKLWPLLLARADEADREEVRELEAEHALLDPLLTATSAAFDDFAAGRGGAPQHVVELLHEMRDLLVRHLKHEESLLPMMADHVSPGEWEAFVEPQRRADSPASSRWFLLWLLEDAPAPARHRLLSRRTPVERLMLKRFWEPLHSRRLRATFDRVHGNLGG
ncbi:hemerythrin domain-containing protein [Streptomyces sp. NPDC051018]|uniref:hemerythrin domain-containing protein n=1 Tax=Streptomyces sp. NPDC051018 TaxID=3365639 RepID=UPI00379FBB76